MEKVIFWTSILYYLIKKGQDCQHANIKSKMIEIVVIVHK